MSSQAHMLVSFIPDPNDSSQYIVKVTHRAGTICDTQAARLLHHLADHFTARHRADTCRDRDAHAPVFTSTDRTA